MQSSRDWDDAVAPSLDLFERIASEAWNRLPAEFRFDTSEVDIRRDAVTGDVVLSRPHASWDDYFDWVRTLDLPADAFDVGERSLDEFCDPFARERQAASKRRGASRKSDRNR